MRVLVTGALSGLGEALTRQLRDRGDDVVATDLAITPDSTGDKPLLGAPYLRLNICSDDDWRAAREWVEQEWGGLDLLINNAGIGGGGRIDVTPIAEWEHLIQVNLLGMVRGLQEFVPLFKAQRSGRIVNVASLAGLVHPAGMGSYNAAKAGVVALSETLSHELHEWGIGVTAVCPSYFKTNLVASMQGTDTAVGNLIGGLVERSPFTADQIAAAVLEGVERGDELILPDPAARAAVDLKSSAPSSYADVMRSQARKLKEYADG